MNLSPKSVHRSVEYHSSRHAVGAAAPDVLAVEEQLGPRRLSGK